MVAADSLPAVRRSFREQAVRTRDRIRRALQARVQAAAGGFVMPEQVHPPVGYRVVTGVDAVAALRAAPPPARADAAATHRALIEALIEFQGRHDDGLIIAGHDALAARMAAHGRRVRASCVGKHVRRLVASGVLHVAQGGCSAVINGTGRDFATVYAVLKPDPPLTAEQIASVHAAMDALVRPRKCDPPVLVVDQVQIDGAKGPIGQRKTPLRIEHPERFAPRNRSERIRSTAWLAHRLGLWHQQYASELAARTSWLFRHGWTAEAIAYAAMHDREGHADSRLSDADKPLRLLSWRLGRWLDGRKRPVPPPVRCAPAPRRGPSPSRASDYVQSSAGLAPATLPTSASVRAALAELRSRLPRTNPRLISRYAR